MEPIALILCTQLSHISWAALGQGRPSLGNSWGSGRAPLLWHLGTWQELSCNLLGTEACYSGGKEIERIVVRGQPGKVSKNHLKKQTRHGGCVCNHSYTEGLGRRIELQSRLPWHCDLPMRL